ncbi:MAG TPA: chromate transporter [Bryobacteraceae bacterium]|nr:chromate transporter [Bryobacteraceae bacterium]
MSSPSLLRLAWLFFRIGNQTFGSGSTTVVLLSREMAERGWLDRSRTDLFYTLARVVPGTNVLAFVAAASHAVRGWAGVLVAIAAYTIPASAAVVLLTMVYERWHTHRVGGEFLGSAMSAITGIIVGAAVLLARSRFGSGERARSLVLVAGAVLLSTQLSPLAILAVAGIAGWMWPEAKQTK